MPLQSRQMTLCDLCFTDKAKEALPMTTRLRPFKHAFPPNIAHSNALSARIRSLWGGSTNFGTSRVASMQPPSA